MISFARSLSIEDSWSWSHQGTDGAAIGAAFLVPVNSIVSINPEGVRYGQLSRAPDGSPVIFITGTASTQEIIIEAEE